MSYIAFFILICFVVSILLGLTSKDRPSGILKVSLRIFTTLVGGGFLLALLISWVGR